MKAENFVELLIIIHSNKDVQTRADTSVVEGVDDIEEMLFALDVVHDQQVGLRVRLI